MLKSETKLEHLIHIIMPSPVLIHVLLWSLNEKSVFNFLLPLFTLLYCVQYKQAAKELLESVSQCSVIKGSCSCATPNTTPVIEENSLNTFSSTPKSPTGRPSAIFFGRPEHDLMDKTCPQKSSTGCSYA